MRYLKTFNQRLGKPSNQLLFHAPGCQVDTFLNSDPHSDCGKVVIMLRDPVQHYMACVSQCLQFGAGYHLQDRVQPDIGLYSILHISLFGVLNAFSVAMRFCQDDRVLVSKLEDFTASSQERKRVWDFLKISEHPALESTTRAGHSKNAGSGIWNGSQIKQVTTDLYASRLTEDEFHCLKQCEYLFQEFYTGALLSVEVIPNEKGQALLYDREINCLKTNRNAIRRRKQRIQSLFKDKPANITAAIKWPARVLYRTAVDILLYPQFRMMSNKNSRATAFRELLNIPNLF